MPPSTLLGRASVLRRLGACLLPMLLGLGGALALLLVAGGPAPSAFASNLTYPGICGATIQQCIDGASAGDTILISAGDYTESLTLSNAVSLTGELSSTTTLHALPFTRVLTVTGAAVDSSVVISGLTFTGGSVTSTTSCPQSCGGAILITDTAQPLLLNLTIRNNQAAAGGGVYASTGSPLTVSDLAVLSNSATNSGGGIFAQASLTVSEGFFQNNLCTAANCGGGGLWTQTDLSLSQSEFISDSSASGGGGAGAIGIASVTGGLFQNDQCTGSTCVGGGLFVVGGLSLTGTQFVSNTSAGQGGGAAAFNLVTLDGALFQHNQCLANGCQGGGLFTNTALTATATQFLSNTASGYGGGAFGLGSVTLIQDVFQSNQCIRSFCQGGGLYNDNGFVTLTDTLFVSNTSTGSGGGAWVQEGAVSGGVFQNNKCTVVDCAGGGLYDSFDLTMTGTQFLSNTNTGDNVGFGGGSGAAAFGSVSVNAGLFQNNQCTGPFNSGIQISCTGGGLYAGGSLDLTDTQFLSNTSAGLGGGAWAAGNVTVSGGMFQNNFSFKGGGLYALGNTLVNGGIFQNNNAGDGGGLEALGNVTLTGSLFQNNNGFNGGGVYAALNLTATNAQFLNNSSAMGGGGADVFGDAALSGGLFQSNSGYQGGGLRAANNLTATNTQFLSNTAASGSSAGGAYAGGNATLNAGVFQNNLCTGNCAGGGLWAAHSLTATNTQFLSNTAEFGWGGAAAAENVTISGSVIQNNYSWFDGGGLQALQNLTATNTQILSNTVGAGNGGGAYVNGEVTLSGGVFQNNQCTGYTCGGGGLWAAASLAMTNTQFLSNTAHGYAYGGGAYVNGDATLNGGVFQNNQGLGNCLGVDCGGAGLKATGRLSLIGTQFLSNTSDNIGGGALAYAGAVLNGGVFQNNQGGGLYTQAIATVNASVFQNNQCSLSCFGGGLRAEKLTMTATQFLSNSAGTGYGGGLLVAAAMTVTDSLFRGNTALLGGGLYAGGGDGRLVNDLFAANAATYGQGDALLLNSPGSVVILHNTIASPTLSGGTAIWVFAGTVGITDTIIASYTTGITQGFGASAFQDYNLFFGNGVNSTGTGGTHSLTGNPQFLNPAGGDYHLTALSAARDAGIDAGVSVDFEGDPRPSGAGFDMGYDEILSPVALPDIYLTPLNTTLLVPAPGVLGNDTAVDLNPLTALLGQAPLTGTLDLASDGGFTYTAPLGFAGLVTFTYQAVDNGHFSTPTIVTLVIGNLPPVANAGPGQVKTVGQSVTLDGSASSDPDNYLPLAYGWQQTGGAAVVLSSPTLSRPTFTAPDVPAVLTFTLTVSDAYGLASLPATTVVTVTDQAISGLGAAGGSPRVLGSSTPFTATISAGTNVTYAWGFGDGVLGSGAFVSHTYALPGAFQAVVTATNSLGQVTATTTVTVDDIPIAAGDTYTTPEDTPLHVAAPGVLANDTDMFPGGLVAQFVYGPSTGALALAPSGRFTYTAPANFHGLVTFSYRANDGLFSSPPAMVTITVTSVNDPPTLTAPADVTTTAGTSVGPLSFSVGDVDGGPLTVTAQSSNTALVPKANIVLGGSGAARTVTVTPAAGQTGTVTITLSVTDGLIVTRKTFVLTVTQAERKLYLPLVLR